MAEITGKVIPVPIEDEVRPPISITRCPSSCRGLCPTSATVLSRFIDACFSQWPSLVFAQRGHQKERAHYRRRDGKVPSAWRPFPLRRSRPHGPGFFPPLSPRPWPGKLRLHRRRPPRREPLYRGQALARFGAEMLVDLDKETVDFVPNYDESLKEPSVLPSALPNLLVNGSSGIAVGMATNMPPHNLKEISQAIAAYIENPEIRCRRTHEACVSGPDFPTGGIIFGRRGIREAYVTGRGKLIVRGKFIIETMKAGREADRLYRNSLCSKQNDSNNPNSRPRPRQGARRRLRSP